LDKNDYDTQAIDELIVVEGKNDAHAVRKALGKVDVIWTEGFGLTEEKLKLIAEMAQRRGVIVCTDPDFAGKQIRERIKRRVPEAKHVYLTRASALNEKGDDIGLENVCSEEIRKAFTKVLEGNQKAEQGLKEVDSHLFDLKDMHDYGLVGISGSVARRSALGSVLGIGDTNAKQFLYRVQRYGLSRQDILQALHSIERKDV